MNYQKTTSLRGGASPLDGMTCPIGECTGDPLAGKSLAMVYSPCQPFENVWGAEEGLCHGTVFADLYKPFWGAGRMQR